jgi:hypothetical protein
MRFANIGNRFINMDRVQSYYFTNNKQVVVVLVNGEHCVFNVGEGNYVREELGGAHHIVQVVPCTAPLWMVWALDDGTHFAEKVLFFGLCADGGIWPVSSSEGYFDVEKGAFDLCAEDELVKFKNLTRCSILGK